MQRTPSVRPNIDDLKTIPIYMRWEIHDPESNGCGVSIKVDYFIKGKKRSLTLVFDRRKFSSMINNMLQKSDFERINIVKKITNDRDNELVKFLTTLNRELKGNQRYNSIMTCFLDEKLQEIFERICFLETTLKILNSKSGIWDIP